MKRVWIACAVLAALFLLCGSGLLATERSTKDLEGQLNEVQRLADEDKIEEAIEMSRQIEEDWHSAHEFLSTFIEHSRLEQIDQSMAVLTVWLEKDNVQEFMTECRRALSQLIHLKDTEIPTWGNIL